MHGLTRLERNLALGSGWIVGMGCKWIDGYKTVIAGMPPRRMVETRGMIHDGDPEGFTIKCSAVVDPIGRLAPDFFHRAPARGIGDHAGASLLSERIGN